MNDCRWLKPVLVGQFEFREWTQDNHLRHSRFVALHEDRRATDVRPGSRIVTRSQQANDPVGTNGEHGTAANRNFDRCRTKSFWC